MHKLLKQVKVVKLAKLVPVIKVKNLVNNSRFPISLQFKTYFALLKYFDKLSECGSCGKKGRGGRLNAADNGFLH